MAVSYFFFWQDLTGRQRRWLFLCVFWLLVAALVGTWIMFYVMEQRSQRRVDVLAQRYAQAAPLVEQALELQARKGALAGMGPMPAAQQVIREMGLDNRLASIRPTQLGGGAEGVQLIMESINLPELLTLMDNLDHRAGLGVLNFSLSRRLDNKDLADLQLVLAR
jgi:type II secretory pathway component PulM